MLSSLLRTRIGFPGAPKAIASWLGVQPASCGQLRRDGEVPRGPLGRQRALSITNVSTSDRFHFRSQPTLELATSPVRRGPNQLYCGPCNDKTRPSPRNETSTKRMSRSANAQKERYDVRLQPRARGKPSRQSGRPTGVDRIQQFHYTRICRGRKPAVGDLPGAGDGTRI